MGCHRAQRCPAPSKERGEIYQHRARLRFQEAKGGKEEEVCSLTQCQDPAKRRVSLDLGGKTLQDGGPNARFLVVG